MEKNKTVPDIEKLQHHDFDLDVDEQHRLQTVGDAEVNRVGTLLPNTNSLHSYVILSDDSPQPSTYQLTLHSCVNLLANSSQLCKPISHLRDIV